MSAEITALLAAWKAGDEGAGAQVAEVLYQELQQIARFLFSRERAGHTLQTDALVHELYLRLFQGATPDVRSRTHFVALAAQQIRRILIDHARKACASKRGNRPLAVTITRIDFAVPNREQEILEIDELLQQLHVLDPRAARVVELRFYGGLEETEIAEELAISVATVKRDWQFARAWFIKALQTPK